MECISRVEFRGVKMNFLYRKDGDVAKARALVRRYLANKETLDLSDVDTETITLILKLFLASLNGSLITDDLRDDFIKASRIRGSRKRHETLHDVVERLPPSNHDTLIFLLEHLRHIIDAGNRNILNRLAEVFGPIVVGGSSQYLTPSLFMISREDQIEVFKSLLELDFSEDENLA
ncbi:rho GTPase-activating protein 15-like [Venturia canescens]|uniref:rho GTPase-activating protein 15-like n=1 Tax=Venturia canescens TaxID=32260 RepID=UPI001C9C1107|nr:rho GTPase-activating protein 15-like [Venturia canescens]